MLMRGKKIILKKLSIKFFINFAFAFIVLFYFMTCIYQNSTGSSLLSWCTRFHTPERGWRGVGELNAYFVFYKGLESTYSVFVKENLFKDDCYGHVLVMPSPKGTNPEFFFSFSGNLSFYLFPVKIEIDNSYKFVLDEIAFRKLSKLPLITKTSGKTDKDHLGKRFCLVQGIKANDYKKWAIYVFPTKEAINFFTLPIGWQGAKDNN